MTGQKESAHYHLES